MNGPTTCSPTDSPSRSTWAAQWVSTRIIFFPHSFGRHDFTMIFKTSALESQRYQSIEKPRAHGWVFVALAHAHEQLDRAWPIFQDWPLLFHYGCSDNHYLGQYLHVGVILSADLGQAGSFSAFSLLQPSTIPGDACFSLPEDSAFDRFDGSSCESLYRVPVTVFKYALLLSQSDLNGYPPCFSDVILVEHH